VSDLDLSFVDPSSILPLRQSSVQALEGQEVTVGLVRDESSLSA